MELGQRLTPKGHRRRTQIVMDESPPPGEPGMPFCLTCGGEVEFQIVTYCACERDEPIVVVNVPAFVCEGCGERAYTEAVMKELAEIWNGERRPVAFKNLAVFDF